MYSLATHIHTLLHYQHLTPDWYVCYNWNLHWPIIIIQVHSLWIHCCCHTLCWFVQTYNDTSLPLPYRVTSLPQETLCASSSHASLLSNACLHSDAFSRKSHSWKQTYVVLSNWLLSFSNMYFKVPLCHPMATDSMNLFSTVIFHCVNVPQFIHSLTEEYLISFGKKKKKLL